MPLLSSWELVSWCCLEDNSCLLREQCLPLSAPALDGVHKHSAFLDQLLTDGAGSPAFQGQPHLFPAMGCGQVA